MGIAKLPHTDQTQMDSKGFLWPECKCWCVQKLATTASSCQWVTAWDYSPTGTSYWVQLTLHAEINGFVLYSFWVFVQLYTFHRIPAFLTPVCLHFFAAQSCPHVKTVKDAAAEDKLHRWQVFCMTENHKLANSDLRGSIMSFLNMCWTRRLIRQA